MTKPTAKGPPTASRVKAKLTPRELEILSLMAQAMSNREIGRTLMITEGTVKIHVHSILSKLAVNSRTGAVRKGFEGHLF